MLARTFTALLGVLAIVDVSAGEWTRFRGPNGSGVARDADPPITWSDTENVSWGCPVPGHGWSSPVVLEDRVWITTATDEGRSLRALAVAADTGKVVHDVEVFTPAKPVGRHERNSWATPTAVLEKSRAYVHFGAMGTAAIDTRSGRIVWRNDTLRTKHTHGPTSSPILFEDLVIVQIDGPAEKFVAALEKDTGRVAWKRARSAPYRDNTLNHQAHTTPVVCRVDGAEQLVSVAADQTHSLDPRTGRELWHVRYRGFANVASPVVARSRVFVSTGFGGPEMWSIRPGGRGDVTDSRVEWRSRRAGCKIPTPVVAGRVLYVAKESGIVSRVDLASGEETWRERLPAECSASPVWAAGRLYVPCEDGRVAVYDTGTDAPKLVATNLLPGRLFATPAIVDRALFVRTESTLYRVEDEP